MEFRIPRSALRIFSGAVAERRMHFTVYEDDDGSSPFGPAKGTPASLPAKLYGRLAETDQRRFEEPKSLVRYQERPPYSGKQKTLAFSHGATGRFTLGAGRIGNSTKRQKHDR